MMPRILVVEDDEFVARFIQEVLQDKRVEAEFISDGFEAAQVLEKEEFDILITDMKLPGMTGFQLLKRVKEISPSTLVVVMTAYASVQDAVRVMKEGAFDYIPKPFSPEELELILQRAQRHITLLQENRALRSALRGKGVGEFGIIGRDPKMLKIFDAIERIARTKATVLISGESGTGKELVAEAIHNQSPWRNKPFIKVNCAALPEGLLESELFGHEKGAFTGAHTTKRGKFELADGGTILLDEISEIKPQLQAKLLRVLQSQEFERVGGVQPIKVDVRVIATTNRKLEEAIRAGQFREDLYYRLNVVRIHVPPLRERMGDVPLLAMHFLKKFCKECGRQIKGISKEALEKLTHYPWPGNVRELENCIEQAVIMARGALLEEEDITLAGVMLDGEAEYIRVPFGRPLSEVEREVILYTLNRVGGNRTKTARILGISVRTLRNKLREYREGGKFFLPKGAKGGKKFRSYEEIEPLKVVTA